MESSYRSRWEALSVQRSKRHRIYIEAAPYSDLKVVEAVLESIPAGYQLQLANSSVARYVQLFPSGQRVGGFANRGTGGIEGSTSTVLGAAWAVEGPTVFLTGDLSFFYDSHAL